MTIADQLTAIAENVPKVYRAGQEAFWDTLQAGGARTDYSYGFCGKSWTDETFRPKYDILPTNAYYMFYMSKITDLKKLLDDAGVKLDFSGIRSNAGCARVFDSSKITRVGVVDISGTTDTLNTFFGGATELQTIELLKLSPEGSTRFGEKFFQSCGKLENITVDGVIDCDLNMSECPLSEASLQSVIDQLSTAETQRTLLLSDIAKVRLTDEMQAAVTAKNWTVN